MIIELEGKVLQTENEDFWVAPDANVIGDVYLAKDASVWFNCTIEGIMSLLLLEKVQMFKMEVLFILIQAFLVQLVNLLR